MQTTLTKPSVIAAGLPGGPALYGQKDDGGASNAPDVADAIKALTADIKKKHDEFNEDLARLKTDSGDQSKSFKDFKDGVDVKLGEYNDSMKQLSEKLDDLAQKSLRAGPNTPDQVKSLGQQVIADDRVKEFRGGRIEIKIDDPGGMKSITSVDASAGHLIEPQRQPGVVLPPTRTMTVRQMLAQGTTTSNAVEFVRELVFTNNAGMQSAEGALKPESDISYELADAKVRTMAHWIHVSQQAMEDAAGLQSQIDSRLRYGLLYKEELQLLKGDGTGTNLEGLVTAASAFSAPAGVVAALSNATNIDVLRVAALQATVNEYMASGFVLNPIDWALIELTKTSEGLYVIGNPSGQAGANLWNLPVAATNAMDPDQFLSGAFAQAAQIFDRMDTTVAISTEDRDNFVKNQITVLAEKRLALAIYRGDAMVTDTFTAAKTALNA